MFIFNRKKGELILSLILLILLFIIIIFFYNVFTLSSLKSINALFYQIGKFFGLLAFLFLSLLIFSGDMARYFDRFWGLDRIIKFQRKFSYFTLIFVLLHPIFFILADRIVLYYTIPDFTFLPLAFGIMSLYIFILVMIASKMYKRISYYYWQYIHIVTYLLFFFSLYHALFWGSDSGKLIIRIIFFAITTLVLLGIIYRTHYKLFKKSYLGQLVEIKEDSSDIFTVRVLLNRSMSYTAGQFCFLRINKNKLYARHPFTIASSPKEEILSFSIKNTGRFTKTLKNMEIGEKIFLDGPFGLFTLKNKENYKIVFIAGGIGITPFVSMLKDRNSGSRNINQKITLFYSARKMENLIYKDFFNGIKDSYFTPVFILSHEERQDYQELCQYGILNRDLMQKYVTDDEETLYFICGPESMKEAIVRDLSSRKVPRKRIFIEDFFW
jgi:predicted ferric reductase